MRFAFYCTVPVSVGVLLLRLVAQVTTLAGSLCTRDRSPRGTETAKHVTTRSWSMHTDMGVGASGTISLPLGTCGGGGGATGPIAAVRWCAPFIRRHPAVCY